jgi:hypothetical protein
LRLTFSCLTAISIQIVNQSTKINQIEYQYISNTVTMGTHRSGAGPRRSPVPTRNLFCRRVANKKTTPATSLSSMVKGGEIENVSTMIRFRGGSTTRLGGHPATAGSEKPSFNPREGWSLKSKVPVIPTRSGPASGTRTDRTLFIYKRRKKPIQETESAPVSEAGRSRSLLWRRGATSLQHE